MATRPRGNGSYIDWLMLSCDTSPCDLSPERIPEKYGRPVKSAIGFKEHQQYKYVLIKRACVLIIAYFKCNLHVVLLKCPF